MTQVTTLMVSQIRSTGKFPGLPHTQNYHPRFGRLSCPHRIPTTTANSTVPFLPPPTRPYSNALIHLGLAPPLLTPTSRLLVSSASTSVISLPA